MSGYEVIIKDRIYIPLKIVDEYTLNDKFMPNVYNETKCKKCPYLPDRHSDTCDECPAFLGQFKLYKDKKINGVKHVGIPVGNKKSWRKLLTVKEKYVTVVDKRAAPKFRYKIKCVRDLYENQVPAVKNLIKYNNGLLQSDPRTGKTVMMIAAAVGKGMRTLILASQYDWLEQFYSTIMGNKAEGELPFTNIPKLEKKYGKKICVIAEDGVPLTKYKDADIILSTYQRFISKKGAKQLAKVKKLFGLIQVDEVDTTKGRCFTKVVNEFQARARLGCSATLTSKDGMTFLLPHVFGPVLYKVKSKNLKPRVMMVETGVNSKHNYSIVPYAYRFLANQKKRNELILDWVMHDLKENKRNSILIPTTTVAHCSLLVKMINEKYGKEIACEFTAKTAKSKERRTEIKKMAKAGKYRVIVGIRQMIQRGINVPNWSHLYSQMPISNRENYRQETFRILTPLEGKSQPIIRHFIDKFGFSQGCLRTCVYQTYVQEKFIVERKEWEIINQYLGKSDFKPNITTPKGTIKSGREGKKILKGNLI